LEKIHGEKLEVLEINKSAPIATACNLCEAASIACHTRSSAGRWSSRVHSAPPQRFVLIQTDHIRDCNVQKMHKVTKSEQCTTRDT
jgi:hypothetical protein